MFHAREAPKGERKKSQARRKVVKCKLQTVLGWKDSGRLMLLVEVEVSEQAAVQ